MSEAGDRSGDDGEAWSTVTVRPPQPARWWREGRLREALVCDAGAGSVLVLTGLTALIFMGVVALAVIAAQVQLTKAASAADLAALAAASSSLAGAEVACARAAQVAEANEASLAACRLAGTQAWVEVRIATPEALRRTFRAPSESRARARAELVADRQGGAPR